MSDLFTPLREPETVTGLAPAEVRRRGDRLRRRRAGLVVAGAAAVAAVVVGGTSLVVDDATRPDSSPRPVDSPGRGELIPDELFLADGMSQPLANLSAGSPAIGLVVCGEKISLADRAVASRGVKSAGRGDFTGRGLVVYPDADTARSVATGLAATFEECPRFTDGRGWTWTTSIEETSYGDQGWVVTRSGERSASRLPEAVQVVRVEETLLVVHQREIHGVDLEVLASGTGRQVEWLLHRQLCLLTDEGCAWRSDPDVLRPDGWGPWRLGMTREDLEAMDVEVPGESAECVTVDLESEGDVGEAGEGLLSPSGGLVSIQGPAGVTTPDGVGLGDSRKAVLDAYVFVETGDGVLRFRASPTTDYEFTVELGAVTRLVLSTVGDECSG